MMGIGRIYRILESDLQRVEERLLERTASKYEFVDLAVQHVIEGGGKRLRPILLILSAKSVGYAGDAMYDLAAAMELIHVASLAHDDVIDEAQFRRSRETLNVKFGNKVAVLVGDYMHARVLAILVACGAPLATFRVVAEATQGMCEGEVVHAYKTDDFDLQLEDYLRIIRLKTAKLIESCCTIGALLGTDEAAKIDALTAYGHRVGIAFQIIDDVLDLTGEAVTFGKPTRNDLREGKLTLPIMHARDRCSAEERRRLQSLFYAEERSAEEIEWIVALAEKYGSVDHAMGVAGRFSREAKDALGPLDDSPAKSALYDLVDYLVRRDY